MKDYLIIYQNITELNSYDITICSSFAFKKRAALDKTWAALGGDRPALRGTMAYFTKKSI